MSKWTPEPWASGGISPPIFAGSTQIVGVYNESTFILASFNHNFEQLAIANVSRAVACVNAMAGIPDPAAFVEAARRVAEWSNPPASESDLSGMRLAVADLAATLETKP